MLKERLVSFEQAKLLVKKGFPRDLDEVELEHLYDRDGHLDDNLIDDPVYPAPTLSLVHKWLYESFNLFIEVYTDLDDCDFAWALYKMAPAPKDDEFGEKTKRNVVVKELLKFDEKNDAKTPEDVLSLGVDYALSVIK